MSYNRNINYCCKTMSDHVNKQCEHPDHMHNRINCPDVVLQEFTNGVIGILIKGKDGAVYDIAYCPFCGEKL